MNLPLKFALIKRGKPAYKTGLEAGIEPTRLSKIISEVLAPTEMEKGRLADILGQSVEELFPKSNKHPAEVA